MNREYIYHEYTNSLCNECLKVIPAKVIFESGKVYILKHCDTHGEQKELLEHDKDYYVNKRRFDKPGTKCKTQTKTVKGCPYDCGLCEMHDQHSCISLIEVTNRCNMNCNTCYANSGKGVDLELSKIIEMMDFVVESEDGNAEILQISGGEPTLHTEILDIIKAAKKRFKHVMLNTNGVRIAEDEEFVIELSKLVGNFEIYLQFDTFNKETYFKIRNNNNIELKQKCIDMLNKYNIPTTLVMTVENGINDNEIGQVVSYSLENKCIRGLNIQPVAYFGRKENNTNETCRENRSTLTDVINKIEDQTKKMLKREDFIPLPCNVERVALTYLYKNNGNFIPITRGNIVEKYLPYINNTFMFKIEDALKDGKNVLFNSCCCNVLSFLKDFRNFVPKDFLKWDMNKRVEYINENTFRISISSFIDRYNFDTKSMQKECVHVITEDMKKIPFSSYNTIYREKK
ncbi:MAG: radical SAM protein [Clostridia bacterium]|nr:radical SAM protein [Clostridia bacterium]MDD4387054.1 radical SAM protein [Clostridia bacterium]